ncbi:Signal transduction histidine kinase [Brevibacterium antiquum CNRZ 918]|uniref:histidine kinase n=1 Tax=Brevibacterium antiquum CNRZ 918 TaxID=1255637 RepID=A0A2H1JPY9_9MICO|nr:Signal transduction histidine kinase [Brevibacterium antiquum CNRZ 918]
MPAAPTAPHTTSQNHGQSAPTTARADGPVASPSPVASRSDRKRHLKHGVQLAVSILVGVAAYVTGLVISAMALQANPWAFGSNGELTNTGIVVVLLLCLVWLSVFLRRRWPLVPFIVGALLAAGWGDGLLLLIGMFHIVVRGPRARMLVTAVIGSALITAGVIRHCLLPPELNPFGIMIVGDPTVITDSEASAPPADSLLAMNLMTIIAGVVGLGVSIGFGLLLRRTRRMRAVETIAQREAERSESLTSELARQSERNRLARELHDTLSHRLSVISLHSSALEVGTQDDAEVATVASALRREARASLEDLRHLVGGVREGTLSEHSQLGPTSTPPSLASMDSIPQLIASVQATGTQIRPSIILQDVESAPTVLDRAVYRIVQESLTNALKHSPDAPVDLNLSVSANQGARIVVSNSLPTATTNRDSDSVLSTSGSGAGLEGIRERAHMLSGTVDIGPRESFFVVDVSFPPFERQPQR